MASERKVEASRIYQDMYEYLGSVLYKKNILGLGIALYAHDTEAKEAPCFMQVSTEDHVKFISRVLKGDRRTFVAKIDGEIAAFIDIADSAETFVTYHPKMINIQGVLLTQRRMKR